jgi:hypothetical protein
MSLFGWLIVAHVVGDFLLQSGTMATLKAENWLWMGAHVGLYMIPVSAVCIVYTLSAHLPIWLAFTVLLFLAGTHALLDRRGFRDAWMRMVGIPLDHPWLPSAVDQAFHLVTLALAAQALVLGSR